MDIIHWIFHKLLSRCYWFCRHFQWLDHFICPNHGSRAIVRSIVYPRRSTHSMVHHELNDKAFMIVCTEWTNQDTKQTNMIAPYKHVPMSIKVYVYTRATLTWRIQHILGSHSTSRVVSVVWLSVCACMYALGISRNWVKCWRWWWWRWQSMMTRNSRMEETSVYWGEEYMALLASTLNWTAARTAVCLTPWFRWWTMAAATLDCSPIQSKRWGQHVNCALCSGLRTSPEPSLSPMVVEVTRQYASNGEAILSTSASNGHHNNNNKVAVATLSVQKHTLKKQSQPNRRISQPTRSLKTYIGYY